MGHITLIILSSILAGCFIHTAFSKVRMMKTEDKKFVFDIDTVKIIPENKETTTGA